VRSASLTKISRLCYILFAGRENRSVPLPDLSLGGENVETRIRALTASFASNPDGQLWKFTYLNDAKITLVQVLGEITAPTWRRLLADSIEQAHKQPCDRYLVDYRRANVKMSVIDLYNRPKYYAQTKMSHDVRVALVFSEGYQEADFIEAVTQNRDYQVKVFTASEPAIVWLTQ